jgi:hypothetical protein
MNLETDDPEKGQLLQKSAHHRELLEEEVKFISERSEKIITNALIIGGTLAFTYMLVRSLSSSPSEKQKRKSKKVKLISSREGSEPASEANSEPEEAGIVSQIGGVLVAQATGFLLSLAREKLVEFLQSQIVKKENTNEHS